MFDLTWARHFAQEWIDAWNTHDLERIMSHYTDDFEMSSPLIIERMGEPSGRLKGKSSIRKYWQQGLDATPPLRFELLDVCVGVDSIVIYYKSLQRKIVCEMLFFNSEGLVLRGFANYGRPAGP